MRFRIVVAGTSLGGFHALKTVLYGLPKDFLLPVVLVQHRSFEESELFAPLLAAYVSLPVVEIDDKQEIKAGQIFVGPMVITWRSRQKAPYHRLGLPSTYCLSRLRKHSAKEFWACS